MMLPRPRPPRLPRLCPCLCQRRPQATCPVLPVRLAPVQPRRSLFGAAAANYEPTPPHSPGAEPPSSSGARRPSQPKALARQGMAGNEDEESEKARREAEFNVNKGRAIEAVLDDTNNLFTANHQPDLTVYEPEVFFKENVFYEFHLQGVAPYGRLLRWTRSLLWVYYSQPDLEVTKVFERSPHELSVAWKFTAMPRPLIMLGATGGHTVVYEGLSIYRFSDRGHIISHVIDNVVPTPLPFAYTKQLRSLLNISSPLTYSK